MSVQSLGYVGIRAKSLADWGDYGTKLLGLQRIDKSASSLAFRMDDRKQRIIVDQDGGAGVGFFGWEVADAAALDALAAKLEAAGVKVARGARALADERRVKDLIVLADPLGNRVEIFHGAETAADPFKPGRSISGFRTGALGMGHVVLSVENADAVMPFYRDLLGFRLSDYYHKPFSAYFMHVNPRHHSLAFVQTRQERRASHDDGAVLVSTMSGRATTSRNRRTIASPSRSAATPAIISPRSTAGRRRSSWSSTAGADG